MARSSRVEDIERLKQEFSQQRRDLQAHNEAELASLRAYFEQRLRAAEEGYRQEIALLQLRLVEVDLEDSVLKTGDDRSAGRTMATWLVFCVAGFQQRCPVAGGTPFQPCCAMAMCSFLAAYIALTRIED